MHHLDAAWRVNRVSIQVVEERVWGLATNREIGDQSRDWSLLTSLSIPTVGHECRNAEKSLEGHGTPFRFFRHSGHWSFWTLVMWLPPRITRL